MASGYQRQPRGKCVEPRPLAQTGPQGDSLPACGTRRRRRPSRLKRARRREAHWTVVASPPKKANRRDSQQLQITLLRSVCSEALTFIPKQPHSLASSH